MKLIKLFSPVLLFLIIAAFVLPTSTQSNFSTNMPILNPELTTIKQGWKGNPVVGKIYINLEDEKLPSFGKIMLWMISKNPQRKEKRADTWLPHVVSNPNMLDRSIDKIVWLGHATFLITLGGKNFITDPIFNGITMLKRRTQMPIDPNLLKGIDYVLLSHGHFDHCDKKSLKLLQRLNPDMEILTGLNMKSLLHGFDKNIRLQEAGWYQQYRMKDDFAITYMPAKHWYNRTNFDKNKRLWGSFVIQYRDKTIYFMGDSGPGNHFAETANFFQKIDVCIMGVGAYKPEDIMRSSHLSPTQALEAFNQLQGKRFIPMHYATFDLADEPLGEPYRILEKHKQQGDDRILLPALGETVNL